MEERDGRDKIERELSVTVTETGSVGGGGEQQSLCEGLKGKREYDGRKGGREGGGRRMRHSFSERVDRV